MDRTNRNTALASAFVEELARCGVRHAVISPGSRSSPLALALWRAPAIEARVIVDERSAGFFALGAAQATGRPVAVLTTSGTAAANLHPAVCEADEAAVPLIVLTADRPPELRAIGAGQTIDQLKLYGAAVRWFFEGGTHEADDAGLLHLRSLACRVYAAARGEPRPGPVHLNISWRDPLGPEPAAEDVTATSRLALEGRGERPLTAVAASRPLPDPALLDELAERVGAEDRGLLVCGRQRDLALGGAAAGLAAATGYPILAEPTSQVRCGDHDLSRVVWTYDHIARVRPDSLEPRIAIRFGDLPTSKALRHWLGSLDGLHQVVVDPSGGWNEPTKRAETIIRAEPTALAAGLVERLGSRRDGAWLGAWLQAGAAAADALDRELAALDRASEPAIHAALGRLYAEGDLIYTASSMPIRDQESFLSPIPARVSFLCNRGANGIDGLISSGIGAAAATGRPAWIVTGDLGLFHDMNGLATREEGDPPVSIVVLNNDGGGIFELLPQAEQVDRDEFEALFGTPTGLDLEKVTGLHGLDYARIERVDELQRIPRERAVLAEVPVDRRHDAALRGRLAEAASEALRSVTALSAGG